MGRGNHGIRYLQIAVLVYTTVPYLPTLVDPYSKSLSLPIGTGTALQVNQTH